MGYFHNAFDGCHDQTDINAVIRDGREILFQAFNWESHKYDWWRNLDRKIADIAKSGFTSAWLPPPSQSLAPEGYLPQDLYSLNSAYGSEHMLKSLLHKMKQYKVRAMADIVINHRVGTTRGYRGMYNRYDGISLPWDEHAVTSCTGGLGNRSTGENFNGVPNIDHTQEFVRKDLIGWLRWLRNTVGFQDFRFDFARGYSAKYVKEYIEAAKPLFSVGEYWDSCKYNGHGLDYNQDSHRQRIVNWIDATGQLSAAFDFTTKGILQEAVKGQFWRLRDCQGKPPGVVGWWPSRAVTFLDNHDTGSSQAHWPFPSHHIMEGYAYILTHPGIPSVFYDHFYDWGDSIHDQIVKLIDIRRHQDIHSRSSIRILEAHSNLYAAIVGEKLCMKLGDGSWCPSGREWKLATSGHRFAVWHKQRLLLPLCRLLSFLVLVYFSLSLQVFFSLLFISSNHRSDLRAGLHVRLWLLVLLCARRRRVLVLLCIVRRLPADVCRSLILRSGRCIVCRISGCRRRAAIRRHVVRRSSILADLSVCFCGRAAAGGSARRSAGGAVGCCHPRPARQASVRR